MRPHNAHEWLVFLHSGRTNGNQHTGQKMSSSTMNIAIVKQSISSVGMVRVFCLQYGHWMGTELLCIVGEGENATKGGTQTNCEKRQRRKKDRR